jgi:hypothetical protein
MVMAYRLAMSNSSIAVILSTRGTALDLDALGDMPNARVVHADIARGEKTACVAATLEHECSKLDLLAALRPWAAGRGWSITVASLP